MAKNKKIIPKSANQRTDSKQESLTLQDQLNSDVLAKLKLAKKSLVAKEEEKEAERQAQLVFERKQREKNMSFEEMFEKYGDKGSKY